MIGIALLYAVLLLGDLLTTAYGMSLGAYEANPFGPGAFVLKVVLIVPLLGLVRMAGGGWWALPGAVALSAPVMWNLVQLGALR